MSALHIVNINKPDDMIEKSNKILSEVVASEILGNEGKEEQVSASSLHTNDPLKAENVPINENQFQTVNFNCYCQRNGKPFQKDVTFDDLQGSKENVKNPNILCFTCKSEFHQSKCK